MLDDKGKLKLAEKGEEDISETLICPMQTAFENKAYKLYSIALHVSKFKQISVVILELR